MSPRLRIALMTVGAAALVAMLALSGRKIVERRRTFDEISGLRERLYGAREEADGCRRRLAAREREFRAFDDRIDSLRTQVRDFESLDRRGVPEEQYEAYLEAFDRYNDSVDVWEGRAAALRAAEDACRSAVEAHNSLSDSLRARLAEEGI